MPTDEPKLFLLGSSHRVASLEERELISLPTEQVDLFYQGLRSLPGMKECLLLNTCNRTEIYGAGNGGSPLPAVRDYLRDFRQLEVDFLNRHFYQREGEAVVRHAFEVASGIDSQMVGETEILGQVKEAYEDALRRKSAGKLLNRMFQKVFKPQNGLALTPAYRRDKSIWARVICELTRRIFGNVDPRRVF